MDGSLFLEGFLAGGASDFDYIVIAGEAGVGLVFCVGNQRFDHSAIVGLCKMLMSVYESNYLYM